MYLCLYVTLCLLSDSWCSGHTWQGALCLLTESLAITVFSHTLHKRKFLDHVWKYYFSLGPMLWLWWSMGYGHISDWRYEITFISLEAQPRDMEVKLLHVWPAVAAHDPQGSVLWGRSNEQKYHPYHPRRSRGWYGSDISASLTCSHSPRLAGKCAVGQV